MIIVRLYKTPCIIKHKIMSVVDFLYHVQTNVSIETRGVDSSLET